MWGKEGPAACGIKQFDPDGDPDSDSDGGETFVVVSPRRESFGSDLSCFGVQTMKINYYPETDSMYIDLSPSQSVESLEVSQGVVLDYDSDGNITGIDIDNASRKLDLEELVLNRLPTRKQVMAA